MKFFMGNGLFSYFLINRYLGFFFSVYFQVFSKRYFNEHLFVVLVCLRLVPYEKWF